MNAASTNEHSSATVENAQLALRNLYFGRFVFAVAWAALFALTSSPFRSTALTLAVLYPLFDVAAALLDARSAFAAGRSTVALYVNMGVSAVAAVALVLVGTGDVGDILLVWGVWAIASGAVQLFVGVQRRAQKGHLPMIISGSLSVLAGTSFAISADSATSVSSIAGYAVLGGVFFLLSALRLRGRGDQSGSLVR